MILLAGFEPGTYRFRVRSPRIQTTEPISNGANVWLQLIHRLPLFFNYKNSLLNSDFIHEFESLHLNRTKILPKWGMEPFVLNINSKPKEKRKIEQHITPGNGERHEKKWTKIGQDWKGRPMIEWIEECWSAAHAWLVVIDVSK